jgi:hypothetical protein
MSTLSQKKSGHHEIQQAQPLRTIKSPYSMGSSVPSRGKAVRSEINHTPQSSAEVNDEWSYTSKPPVCLQSMDKENVPFKSVFQHTNKLKKKDWYGECARIIRETNEACQKYLEQRAKQKEYQQKKKQI